MILHSLFLPALTQIQTKWPTLSTETKAKMVANLPDLAERHAFLDWNARLSAQDPRLLEPCQAAYAAVMAWDGLSEVEKIVVVMAAMDPLTKLAAGFGLIAGVPAGIPRRGH